MASPAQLNPWNLERLNGYIDRAYGDYRGLSDKTTPQAQAFLQHIDSLNRLRGQLTANGSGVNHGYFQSLPWLKGDQWNKFDAASQKTVDGAVSGVNAARTQALADQLRAQSNPPQQQQQQQQQQPPPNGDPHLPPPPEASPPNISVPPQAKTPPQGRYKAGATWDAVVGGKATFKKGDKGPGVEQLQRALAAAGYWPGQKGIDQKYGPQTQAALDKFYQHYPQAKNSQGQVDANAIKLLLAHKITEAI